MPNNRFCVGQIIHHKQFGYRGVVYDVDPVFSLTEEWYQTMAISKPPKNKPWYHILVDCSERITYVTEQNLEEDVVKRQIDHPLLGQYFKSYNGNRYTAREDVPRD